MEIVLYLEINLVCIAILLSVYIRDRQQRNNDTFHILFTRVLFSNVLFFLADILWGLMSLTESPHIVSNWIVNIIYFSSSGIAAYFWLCFVEKMIGRKPKKSTFFVVLRLLPPLLLILLTVTSVETHWLFYIDAMGKYQRGVLYILQPILAYLLPIYATILSLTAVKKTKSNEQKRQYRSLAYFYFLPALGGIFQIIVAGTPMLNIGITLSALWLYFNFQDNITMLDPLTGMNNRRFFDIGLESSLRTFSSNTKNHFWLILMDVDYFKKINDGFGHAEGDKALITIGNALKEISLRFTCTVSRVGGDEFALYFESEDPTMPEQLSLAIKKSISEKSAHYPFKLSLCMGLAEYREDMTPQQLYVLADNALYEAKSER